MLYLKLVAAILAAVFFGGKVEDTINKYLQPSDDFMVKLVHYGAPVATGVGTFTALSWLLGSK